MGQIKNIFLSTRIKRVLLVLILILIPAAFKNILPKEIILLQLIVLLIYSSSSIFNAIKDNDYKLPKYSKKIIIILFLIAILISLTNKILFIATLSWIILGFIYNTVSRKIILGDAFIAGLTHFAIPLIISSILVGIQTNTIILLGIIGILLSFSIGPTTNLKDIKEDKKRKYKTLVSSVKKPKEIASIFLSSSILWITAIYSIFQIKTINFIFLIMPFMIMIHTIKKINKDQMKTALNNLRIYLFSSWLILILILTSNKTIILEATIFIIIYLLTLNKKWKHMM